MKIFYNASCILQLILEVIPGYIFYRDKCHTLFPYDPLSRLIFLAPLCCFFRHFIYSSWRSQVLLKKRWTLRPKDTDLFIFSHSWSDVPFLRSLFQSQVYDFRFLSSLRTLQEAILAFFEKSCVDGCRPNFTVKAVTTNYGHVWAYLSPGREDLEMRQSMLKLKKSVKRFL